MTRGTPIRSLLAAALLVGAAACGDTEQPDSVDAEPIATTTEPTATTRPETPTSTPPTTAPATTAQPTTTQPLPTTTIEEGAPVTEPTDPQPGEWPASVTEAVAALAAEEDRDGADVVVVRYERVTWRDGALGCPDPERAYTQALVPGYRIELELDGVTAWYHGSADGAPFRCDDPSEPAEVGSADA